MASLIPHSTSQLLHQFKPRSLNQNTHSFTTVTTTTHIHNHSPIGLCTALYKILGLVAYTKTSLMGIYFCKIIS